VLFRSGLEQATAGRTWVAGSMLGGLDEDALALFRRDNVGIVFQNYHLIATMTALENVAVPLELAGRDDAMARAEQSLAAVGLGHRLAHYPGQLSGGEQQRVALARAFAPLSYTDRDAAALIQLADAPRTIDGARDLLSVALQYGNAFGQGIQAAALKRADFFGNDDILYLMEDMATGEIRLSILWEWIHKQASLTEADDRLGLPEGATFTMAVFEELLAEEYEKLLQANNKDVHDDSKSTTLPIAREIVAAYIGAEIKLPWYIDLLNINLNNNDLEISRARIQQYLTELTNNDVRITDNPDFIFKQ